MKLDIIWVSRIFTTLIMMEVELVLGASWLIHGDLLETSTIHLLWMLGAR